MLLNLCCMLGKETKKDMMIQDGPPDIPDNLQLTA